jgi:high-affinity iron transporter
MAALRPRCLLLALVIASQVVLGGEPPAAAAGDPAAVRRILVLLNAAGEEYREALDDAGRVVRPIELDEARLLLADASRHASGLERPLATALEARLAALGRAIDAQAPLATVGAEVESARRLLVETTGVSDDLSPPSPPSPARGAAVFAANCESCHGVKGGGDGPQAAGLERKPASFTDRVFMRGETPSDFFSVISVGKRLGAMPAWGDVLSVQERWDVVSYVWSLGHGPEVAAEGQGVFLAHCASCHGMAGDGHGPYAPALLTPVSDLTALDRLGGRTDAELYALLTRGVAGTAMPAFERVLDEDERWKVVAFVRLLSLGGVKAAGATPGPAEEGEQPGAAEADPAAEASRLLVAAVEAYRRGDPAARDLATDAYFRFEPLETRLGASDPALVRRVEEGFLRLRSAMQRPGNPEVETLAAALARDLAATRPTSGETAGAYARFLQSATIILREGFEVVLIVGALLAYVRRSGSPAMARSIYVGTGLGGIASAGTAVLLSTALRLRPAAAEILEGLAMILAAVVLFWVSYWIISKAEAERWQRYIRGKVQRAVTAGSGVALAATAFLAVYREGFETVLFYQALLGGAPAGDLAVPAGFGAGAVALAVVYGGLSRFGLRIPIRQFFLTTGALLYAMAIIFAGKGVRELQEAAVIGLTPVAGVPELPVLGLFPTLETLAAQAVLVLCLLVGLAVTLRRGAAQAAAGAHAVAAELSQLREQAEALRAELAGLRAVDAAASAGIGERLDGLIGRVRELEARVSAGNGRA